MTNYIYSDYQSTTISGLFIRKLDVLYSFKNLNAEKEIDMKLREKVISDLINAYFKGDIGWQNIKSSELGNVITDIIFNGFETKATSKYVFITDDYTEPSHEIDFCILNPQNNKFYICLKFTDFIYVS